MTFGAVPSIELIGIASPHGSGVVERSPCYALPLNAEPLACHTNDRQLSTGCCLAEPVHTSFSKRVTRLPSWGSSPHPLLHQQILARPYSHIFEMNYSGVMPLNKIFVNSISKRGCDKVGPSAFARDISTPEAKKVLAPLPHKPLKRCIGGEH